MEVQTVDPRAWSAAALELFQGGGWTVIALIALLIVCRWPPWRRRDRGPAE